ncbi:MAG: SPOR domain-containing protein [Bacteroidales bacterium]|nr:SPOR domain-containing protein [Bacteroidales bacterium]
MKKIVITLLFLGAICFIQAQSSVKYDREQGIEQLEEQHKQAWQELEGIEGYRIQITAASGNNSKSTIQMASSEFQANFSNIPTYITYAEPYFRLRVGNYRTRLEAVAALEQIKIQYPGAYIIKDEIKFK